MPKRAAVDPSASLSEPRRSSRTASQNNTAAVDEKLKAKAEKATARKREAPKDKTDKEAKKPKLDADEESKEVPESTEKLIEIGDSLPNMTLKNENDEDIDIGSLAEDKGVVLFLVPKADTPGCTQQACGFRDTYEDIKALGYDVYCLSADSPSAQAKWQKKKSLQYGLISDPSRQLITALGSGKGGKTARSHYVFEKGGKLVDFKRPVKPVDSPTLALKFIQGTKE